MDHVPFAVHEFNRGTYRGGISANAGPCALAHHRGGLNPLYKVMTLELSLILGTAFGLLAGAMAYLITFDEYRKHQTAGWHLWKSALSAGAFAFSVFMLLSLAAGVWL